MIKAIIIDDEKNARDAIANLLKECFKNIKIVAEADNVKDGIIQVQNNSPDLLFLDVNLTDGTGFDVLAKTDYKKLKVIFITAHEEYAIKAIKFSAFDYILKPFKSTDLIDSVNRVLKEKIDQNYALKFDAIFSNYNNSFPELQKIVLKTAEKIHLVNIKDIIHCEADNTYTVFYLSSGKKIMVSKTIKTFEEMLSGHGFMRVHQSHLINLNYIQHYDKTEGGVLVMSNNTTVPVSNQRKPMLLKYFSSL